jgi:hypothetical protein
MADRLTQDMIADGMARAEKVACRPGDDRCSPFPDRLEVAQASRSAQRAPEGSSSPTPEARAGTSGSTCRPGKGGCGAGSTEEGCAP